MKMKMSEAKNKRRYIGENKDMATDEEMINNAKFWIGVSYNEISKYSKEIQ